MTWPYAVVVVAALACAAFIVLRLLKELRAYHQTARARIHELEGERTGYIKQVAEARGVLSNDPTDPLGSSPKPHRDFAVDPQTGNTMYADGTVVAPDGRVIVEPGDGELSVEAAEQALG
jgi:hypothetical protein